ncbi:RNA polymerase sigma-30 (SigH) subunit [Hydrogenispora ethanolica]|uniref:RNA polymerase sigma-30 (SigH) subunit n=1 Tax=Hydrogenispora ethanolica TaxID=1082276 RepID=A0A4R1QZ86_HYDET|nr:sigma-70 family RNA polymerase sigma factor [Hydrogenispora ethanolica]TCL58304.1 RNA polymerase sigma-30 (SigH) subunit [Hydrogenispora ethanolica]
MNQLLDLSLISRIRTGQDTQAKEELVKKYLPMVRHIVKIQSPSFNEFEDYFQEGSIGLLKAIDEYDPDNYPIKFSTFAYICILRRIYNLIKQSMSKKAIFSAKALSLNIQLNGEDSRTLLDSIPAEEPEPFLQVENEWIVQKLAIVLEAHLSPVEYQVIQMLLNGLTIHEIQQHLRLSMKAVDNARTRARIKLKKILFQYGSLLNPKIPLKARKRKDLSIHLEVG